MTALRYNPRDAEIERLHALLSSLVEELALLNSLVEELQFLRDG